MTSRPTGADIFFHVIFFAFMYSNAMDYQKCRVGAWFYALVVDWILRFVDIAIKSGGR